MATIDDLREDILKATSQQLELMELRKKFLGSKDNDEQMNAFKLTTQIMKYEDFIKNTESQIRVMK